MKQQYLNAVYTNLILERDFEPVGAFDANRNPELRIVHKQSNGVYFLVEFVDADQLNSDAITAKVRGAHQMLAETDYQTIFHFIGVLVFDNTPSSDQIRAIEAGIESLNQPRKYFSCLTVDLTGKFVSRQTKTSLNTDGVEKILKTYLKESNEGYQDLPDIQKLIETRSEEYSIVFKAKKPTFTYALIGINIAVFLVLKAYTAFYGINYEASLTYFGAKDNLKIFAGEYWRLLTPLFLHANYLHLLVNCYSLFVVGDIVERIYGHTKFLMIYFMAGLYGSIASFIFSMNPAVGASGAIFGILGALAYYGVEKPKIFKKYFGYNVVITIIINVIIGFSMVGIDNYGHLGGLTGGFLMAFAVKVNNEPRKISYNLFMVMLLLLIAFIGCNYGLQNIQKILHH